MSEWTRLGSVADFGETITLVELGRSKIAVARMQDELFAFDGLCPHLAGPMHRAELDGTVVTCPLHGWRFDVRDGGRELHDYRPLRVFEVRIEGDEVHVKL
ncbi:MAG: Rieske (2Fe-2S) protein [Burkholderiales bacterium]|nr:Rieske (2Fe-2S) protein [Burkholderiales bacterium]